MKRNQNSRLKNSRLCGYKKFRSLDKMLGLWDKKLGLSDLKLQDKCLDKQIDSWDL